MNTDLFGVPVFGESISKYKKPNSMAIKAHMQLILINGKSSGNKCKNCINFSTKRFGKTYFKCLKFRDSSCESSDWRANWDACGLFEKKQS
jgi:hypothetical protein